MYTLKDNLNFDYYFIIDIMYIEGKPILDLADEMTRFQTIKWQKNVSAKHVID